MTNGDLKSRKIGTKNSTEDPSAIVYAMIPATMPTIGG